MKDNELVELTLEFVEEFERNEDSYKTFITYQIPNFLKLQKNNVYNKIIKGYKDTKERPIPFIKGYKLTNSFRKWIKKNFNQFFDLFIAVDKNYEILRLVIYTLIYESKKSKKERKSLEEISEFIGVSRWSITQSALLLDELGLFDFNEEFGLKVLQYKSKILKKRVLGIIVHKAINNILTIYFKNEFCSRYYSEPYILLPLSTKHPDGLIVLKDLDQNIKNNIEIKFSKKYDYIILDFTFYSLKRITNKFKKYFPPRNVLFLIICYDISQDIIKIKNIYFPNNVKIISLNYFIKLLRLDSCKCKKYYTLLSEIINKLKTKDINYISKIVENTTTKLYSTKELERRLGTKNLSNIFYRKYSKKNVIKFYTSLIKKDLDSIRNKLKLPKKCALLSNKILKNLIKYQLISPIKDHLSYVASITYISARYLYLPKINRNIITSTLGISSHGFKLRIKEIKELDVIFLNVIYPSSLRELFKSINIVNKECFDLSLKIIKIAHHKIYLDQEEINFAIPITALYLSANNLGIELTQEEIINKVGYKERTVIYNVLRKFRENSRLYKENGIDLDDPFNEKKIRIIKALNNSNGLTLEQIQNIVKINPSKHLKHLLTKCIIEKNKNKYYIIRKGRIITTFEEFFLFYKKNQKTEKFTSNKYYYEEFPYLSTGTIRGWISRARELLNG